MGQSSYILRRQVWEDHKILQSLHLTFDRHSEEKRKVEILKIFLALSEYMNFKEQSLGGFTSEDTGNFLLLQHKYSKSLSWAENLNKLFTVLGRKFKFSAQNSDLEYLCRMITISCLTGKKLPKGYIFFQNQNSAWFNNF